MAKVLVLSIVLSMVLICAGAVTNTIEAVYIVMAFGVIGVLLTTAVWSSCMNLSTIHVVRTKPNMSDDLIVAIYKSIINTYKHIGLIAFSVIIEVYCLTTYADAYVAAALWTIISLTTALVAYNYRKKYDQFKEMKYVLENR